LRPHKFTRIWYSLYSDPLIYKQALRFLKGIANFPWVGSKLSNPQSLTHSAVARESVWLCVFGPVVLHGCTPLA